MASINFTKVSLEFWSNITEHNCNGHHACPQQHCTAELPNMTQTLSLLPRKCFNKIIFSSLIYYSPSHQFFTTILFGDSFSIACARACVCVCCSVITNLILYYYITLHLTLENYLRTNIYIQVFSIQITNQHLHFPNPSQSGNIFLKL